MTTSYIIFSPENPTQRTDENSKLEYERKGDEGINVVS
jgi:hypothetical protein